MFLLSRFNNEDLHKVFGNNLVVQSCRTEESFKCVVNKFCVGFVRVDDDRSYQRLDDFF